MLKLENVSKNFPKFSIKNMSFELEPGYIMGLIGRNGAGKSTLLRMVLGIMTPDSGCISFEGKDTTENEKWVKDNCGFVLTEEVFDKHNTLKSNAEKYGKFYSRYDAETLKSYCEKFNLDINRSYGKQSRGEKMKFQLAFALSHDPKLLILDEPLGSFDPEFADMFSGLLTDFVSTGEKSVILATHITSGLDKFGDYITYIDKGRLVLSEDKETLTDRFRLVTAEDYLINLLPNDKVIYKEKGASLSKALVRDLGRIEDEKQYDIGRPTIEDIMYFMDKGGLKKAVGN